MKVTERVAVFGGSFDPPHVGHVLLAAWALSAGGVDRLLVVPTYAHAFGKRSAAFDDRVAMAELAFSVLAPVEVSRIEERLPAPSYTLRTLEAIAAERPLASLRLLVGADVIEALPRWHEPDQIEALAPLLVGGRSGYARSSATHTVATDVPNFPEVSSTVVRARLARGEDVSSLVPESVRAYIATRSLYGEAPL